MKRALASVLVAGLGREPDQHRRPGLHPTRREPAHCIDGAKFVAPERR